MQASSSCFFYAKKYLKMTPSLLSHFRERREPSFFQDLFSSWVLDSMDSYSLYTLSHAWLLFLSVSSVSNYASFLFFLFVYSYAHTLLGPFLPLPPAPFLSPPTPSLPGRICSALISNFVEEKT
jgi:hypothetical protein